VGWILGIDFGTANTGAAMRLADGRVEKIKLDPSSDTMPSAVVLTDGTWRVGQSALNARRTHPSTFVGSPKALLGQEAQVLGTQMVTPAQIASHVFSAVKGRAVRAAGGIEPDRLVLTHPVRWGRTRLEALREAATIAGFAPERTRLLPEPIAALHAHVTPGAMAPGARVVVVDVGGGTCDVAVLQVTGDPQPGKDLLVVAQEGDDRLGGNDLDNLLYQWVIEQLTTNYHTNLVTLLQHPDNLGATLTLLDVIRGAKQDLSEHTDAPIAITVAGQETTLTITRDEYEKLITEPMQRAATLTMRALHTSNTTNLTAIYLTGGTAYTPALARTLQPITGILAAPIGDPKLATATGALHTPVATLTPNQLRQLTHDLTQQRLNPTAPNAPRPATAPPPSGAVPPPQAAPAAPPRPPLPPNGTPPVPQQPPRPQQPPQGPTPSGGPRQANSGPPHVTSSAHQGPAPQPPAHQPAPPSLYGSPSNPYPQARQPYNTWHVPPAKKKNTTAIAAIIIAAVLVVGGGGAGVWWAVSHKNTPSADPTASQTPTDEPPQEPCWNGSTSDACPAFEGVEAAEYVFSHKPDAGSHRTCQKTSGWVPTGYSEAFRCTYDSLDGSAVITSWPSVSAATDAFLNGSYSYTDAGTWTNGDGASVGRRFFWEPAGSTYATYCYDGIPVCVEFSGDNVDVVNALVDETRALSEDEIARVAEYLNSH
jgi:hypothetical protein